MSMSLGQKLWYHVKGLVIRNTHSKYEGPTSDCIKVVVNVKLRLWGIKG